MDAVETRNKIAKQLTRDGFTITHDELAGQEVIIGRRARFHWTLTRMHVFVFLFVTTTLSELEARGLASSALDYAKSHKGGLPSGLQTGAASIPVMISDGETQEAVAWARNTRKRPFAAFSFPVVIDLHAEIVAHQQRQTFVGAAFLPMLRKIVTTDIAEPIGMSVS